MDTFLVMTPLRFALVVNPKKKLKYVTGGKMWHQCPMDIFLVNLIRIRSNLSS